MTVGSQAVDTKRNEVGDVMGFEGGRIQLRPLRGGTEWDACPEHVRPATFHEVLSAKVKATNDISEGRLP